MANKSLFSKISSVIVFVLVGVLVLSFALWGVADVFNYNSEESAAKVNGTEISKSYVDSAVQRTITQLEQQTGADLSINAKQSIAKSQFESIVNQELVFQEANRLGIVIGENQIKDFIKKMPYFQDESGNFSKSKFDLLLSSNRISEERFVNDSIRDIQVQSLLNAVTEQNILPRNIEEILYKTDFESRVMDLAKIPLKTIKDVGKPSDEQLREFYEAEKENYKLPEYRNAKYTIVNYVDLGDQIDLSDTSLQAIYEQRKAEFTVSEKRELLQIRVDDAEAANAVLDDLKSGTNFSEAGKKVNLTEGQMLLGEYSQDELQNIGILPEAAVNEVFAIDAGKFTSIHEDSLGLAILAVSNVIESAPKPFEDVKSELRDEIIADNSSNIESIANNVLDQLSAGKNINDVATELELSVSETGIIDAEGKTQTGAKADIPNYGDFAGELFTLNNGERSNVISNDEGTEFYIIINDQIIEPRFQTIEEVRGTLTQKWTAQTRFKKLEDLAKSIVAEVKEADDKASAFANAAKKNKLEIRKNVTISKQEPNATEMPIALVSDAFSVKENDITDFYQMADESIGVVLVREVIEPEPSEEKLERLRGGLSGEIAVDYREQFIAKLESENDISADVNAYLETRE